MITFERTWGIFLINFLNKKKYYLNKLCIKNSNYFLFQTSSFTRLWMDLCLKIIAMIFVIFVKEFRDSHVKPLHNVQKAFFPFFI